MNICEINGQVQTLCWDCDPAVFWQCPWVQKGKMPQGTKCIESTISSGQSFDAWNKTYRVIKCPNYVKEEIKPKRKTIIKPPKVITESKPKYESPPKLVKHKNKNRPVVAISLDGNIPVQRYESIKDAAKAVYVNSSGIKKCLAGQRKKSGGYGWKYAEEVQN